MTSRQQWDKQSIIIKYYTLDDPGHVRFKYDMESGRVVLPRLIWSALNSWPTQLSRVYSNTRRDARTIIVVFTATLVEMPGQLYHYSVTYNTTTTPPPPPPAPPPSNGVLLYPESSKTWSLADRQKIHMAKCSFISLTRPFPVTNT